MRFLLMIGMVVCLNAAQRKLPPEFEPLARLALSTPPEFAADGLLRLVESGRISDRDTRFELIQQAFDLGANARLKVPMRALNANTADTREGSLARAYALRLDVVSLQTRAVNAMLAVDAARARRMFQAMASPELPPLTCSDSLVYDVSAYYRTLAAVAGAFSAKEKSREDHLAYLLEFIAGVRASAQVGPMAQAIRSAGLTPEQRDAAFARLSGQLETISADDRSFSDTVEDVSAGMTPTMAQSFAKYVDRHLGNTRCEENVRLTARFGGTEGAKTEGTARVQPYWQSDTAQRLMAGARKLRFGEDVKKVLSDADRGTSEWQQQLADFEKDLAGWTASSEKSESDYYHQKCIVYEALVELIPRGPERDRALGLFIDFVNGSNLQTQSPAEWFVPAQGMLERVRNTNGGEPAKVLAAFEASGNPVLALAAALERTFHHALPSWVPTSSGASN